jgi:hypothetical protein
MCPVCLTTAALMASGAGSLGGLSLFVMKRIRAKSSAPHSDRTHERTEIESCQTIASYPETNGLPRASSI